ncbi:MAG: CMP/dCMP kinase [Actinomycetota bacterium]|nr:CMP/dCMP kinase [Actinomycetota bacterium]
MPADEATNARSGRAIHVDSSTLVVAIDGPSGSGKSTVARGTARSLRLRYLDTGATYRALTWLVLERGIAPDDAEHVSEVADRFHLTISTDPDDLTVLVDGRDVTGPIRGSAVTSAVSAVSAIPEVRRKLVAFQRNIIGDGGIVVEGRDIGTTVCPDAHVKIFLTASATARATRRSADLAGTQDAGAVADVTDVEAELARRDRLDSSRVSSPLIQAADALPVDSTTMDVDAVIAYVLDVVAQRTGVRADATGASHSLTGTTTSDRGDH